MPRPRCRGSGRRASKRREATRGLDDPAYRTALETSRRLARGKIDALLSVNRVTILAAPSAGPAWLSDPVNGDHYAGPSASQLPAVSGYPHLTVPAGMIGGLPVGHLVHRYGVERGSAVEGGVRIRADRAGAGRAGVPADGGAWGGGVSGGAGVGFGTHISVRVERSRDTRRGPQRPSTSLGTIGSRYRRKKGQTVGEAVGQVGGVGPRLPAVPVARANARSARA
jgi:hypothetical protein